MRHAPYAVMAALLLSLGCRAQQDALSIIESNNTTLRALRAQAEADKAEARTTTSLANPEVEFGYLWGSPRPAPARKDLTFSQSLDMATITGSRRRVAQRQCAVAELEYRRARIEIMQEAHEALIQLATADTLLALQAARVECARQMQQAWHKRLEGGEALSIDMRKADLSLAMLESELHRAQVERDGMAQNVARLNGGQPLPADAAMPDTQLPPSFDEWIATAQAASPVLQYATAQQQLAHEQLRMARRQNMPSFTVGYAGELLEGENFNGVTIGLEIPVWGNHRRVKAARAAEQAAQAQRQDEVMQFNARLRMMYDRAAGLYVVANSMEQGLADITTTHDLLHKALDGGQMPLHDYLLEMDQLYEARARVIEAWRDYRLALAALQSTLL